MSSLQLGSRHVAPIGCLLQKHDKEQEQPAGLPANAAYWAATMARSMDQPDIPMVAWLLLKASGHRHIPFAARLTARYWATYLEGRT